MARLLRTGRAFGEGLVGGSVQGSELGSVKDLSSERRSHRGSCIYRFEAA